MVSPPRFAAAIALLFITGCSAARRGEPVATSDTPMAVNPAMAAGGGAPSKPTDAQSPEASAAGQQAAMAHEAAAIAAAMQELARSKTDYKISPADLISVTVYQDQEMNRK